MQATEELTRLEALEKAMQVSMSGRPYLEPEEIYGAPLTSTFRWEKEDLDYLPAPDLEAIVDQLVNKYDEFSHLREKSITCLWKREGGASNGKATLGKCQKVSGLVAHFCEALWLIWLAADYVDGYGMSRQQVEAALYHELLHVGLNENFKPTVVGHDFEAFGMEIRRYGPWHEGLKLNKKAWEQPALFVVKPDTEFLKKEAAKFVKNSIGGGIDSITMSSGGKSVTLDKTTRAKAERILAKEGVQ